MLPVDTITVGFCPLHGQQITDSPDCPVTVGKDYCREPWLRSTCYVSLAAATDFLEAELRHGEDPCDGLDRKFGGKG